MPAFLGTKVGYVIDLIYAKFEKNRKYLQCGCNFFLSKKIEFNT